MSEQQLVYGFTSDNDESVQGKAGFSGGEFGLNEGFLIKFEYATETKDGKTWEALDIWVKTGDSELRNRMFSVGDLFDDNQNTLEVGSPEYIEKAQQKIKDDGAVITHTLKALGVAEDTITAVMSTPATSFKEYIIKAVSLAPKGFETRPLHIFLEYQWQLKKDQKKKFLQMPKNMKGGHFLAPAIGNIKDWSGVTEWVEKDEKGSDINKEGFTYINSNGDKHTFKRNKNFMKSPKAIQEIAGEVSPNPAFTPTANNTKPGNTAEAWGVN